MGGMAGNACVEQFCHKQRLIKTDSHSRLKESYQNIMNYIHYKTADKRANFSDTYGEHCKTVVEQLYYVSSNDFAMPLSLLFPRFLLEHFFRLCNKHRLILALENCSKGNFLPNKATAGYLRLKSKIGCNAAQQLRGQ